MAFSYTSGFPKGKLCLPSLVQPTESSPLFSLWHHWLQGEIAQQWMNELSPMCAKRLGWREENWVFKKGMGWGRRHNNKQGGTLEDSAADLRGDQARLLVTLGHLISAAASGGGCCHIVLIQEQTETQRRQVGKYVSKVTQFGVKLYWGKGKNSAPCPKLFLQKTPVIGSLRVPADGVTILSFPGLTTMSLTLLMHLPGFLSLHESSCKGTGYVRPRAFWNLGWPHFN